MEDLFLPSTGFSSLSVKQSLLALRNHINHNGVQLDGIKHLISLCESDGE
jgi:hypothetical protein